MKTEVFDRITVKQLAGYWISNVALFGALYYGLSFAGASIIHNGQAITTSLEGLGNSIYFSFTTALTIGYGDIVPSGIAKALAVIEAIGSISIIGLLIGKLVSVKQEQILQEVKELSVEEATHTAITELYLFRNQAKELMEKKLDKSSPKQLESIEITLKDALQTFNQTQLKINDPHKTMMHISLITNSITYSLSKLVELLEEFNKRKIGWNRESTTATYTEAERIKATLKQSCDQIKSDDQLKHIVEEKLEDLNKAIANLQKSINKS